MLPSELPDQWCLLAEQQRRFGAESQARMLEYCADGLRRVLEAGADELLSLREAADVSGYSVEHLGRLIREGKLRNAGRRAKPLIDRKELPLKARRQIAKAPGPVVTSYTSDRLFRDIAISKFGG